MVGGGAGAAAAGGLLLNSDGKCSGQSVIRSSFALVKQGNAFRSAAILGVGRGDVSRASADGRYNDLAALKFGCRNSLIIALHGASVILKIDLTVKDSGFQRQSTVAQLDALGGLHISICILHTNNDGRDLCTAADFDLIALRVRDGRAAFGDGHIALRIHSGKIIFAGDRGAVRLDDGIGSNLAVLAAAFQHDVAVVVHVVGSGLVLDRNNGNGVAALLDACAGSQVDGSVAALALDLSLGILRDHNSCALAHGDGRSLALAGDGAALQIEGRAVSQIEDRAVAAGGEVASFNGDGSAVGYTDRRTAACAVVQIDLDIGIFTILIIHRHTGFFVKAHQAAGKENQFAAVIYLDQRSLGIVIRRTFDLEVCNLDLSAVIDNNGALSFGGDQLTGRRTHHIGSHIICAVQDQASIHSYFSWCTKLNHKFLLLCTGNTSAECILEQ